MGHSYEKSKTIAFKTIMLLGVITIAEVIIALLGKGYIIESFEAPLWIMGVIMIVLSLTKAYYIVYEFMHMKYEVPALVRTVLLPLGLLVWAVIAFFMEGNDWLNRRTLIKDKNSEPVEERVIAVPENDTEVLEMEEKEM